MNVSEQKLRGIIRETIVELISEDASSEARKLIQSIDRMQDDLESLKRSAPREHSRNLEKALDHLDEIYNIVGDVQEKL